MTSADANNDLYEVILILEGVAEAFIQSYLEHGNPLPAGVVTAPLMIRQVDEVQVIA